MKKLFRCFTLLAILVFTFGTIPMQADAASPGAIRANTSDAVQSGANIDVSSVIVQLNGDSLVDYVKTHPTMGKKIDYTNSSVKSYQAQLSALRNQYKQWLQSNAPKAKVTGEFDTALNAVSVQLNGETLATVSGSSLVKQAQYEAVYRPLVDNSTDPDLSLINAMSAWSANGKSPANAGEGVRVAIIDTGIDINHPCFFDTGYPAQTQLGNKTFTNNKVIVAKVFNNRQSTQHYTPEAIQEHGTHVAGTVACNANTPAVVGGVVIPYGVSGVAPRALLGNYSVFPGDVGDARSEDILNALETAYKDNFDVANMSLGGGSKGAQDLVIQAVNKLDEAGMVVAIAAGNSGPGHYTVESPGAAERALTAGASTVPHFVGTPVTIGGQTFGAAAGDFPTVPTNTNLIAPLAVVPGSVNGLSTACSALSVNLTGKIALISRGACSFSAKIRNAQNAGALAVLVANNVAGDPTAMGGDGTPNQPTVPAYMVSLADVPALVSLNGASASISGTLQYFRTTNANIMAGFSSQGPTDVTYRVKPDVVAPGVNVLSSIPTSYCGGSTCWAFFQGTSMATPHLAGSAAVVIWQHPCWSAAQIRSAIVNTADRNALTEYRNGTVRVTDPNIIGAGLEQLDKAVTTKVTLDPVSISFGAVPSGASQTKTFDVTLTNTATSGPDTTFALSIEGGDLNVTYSVKNGSLSLAAGQSGTVTVVMMVAKGTASNTNHSGWLVIKMGGTEVAHAAIYNFVK